MIRRILVGLAGTTYTPVAIQRAVKLAKTHNAEVTGVTVLDRKTVLCEGVGMLKAANREAIRVERMEIAQSQIEQAVSDFREACQTAGIKHQLIEESGDPFTALISLARYHDLMVFGLRSVFEYNFLVDDPESLLIRLVSAGVRPMLAVSETFRPVSRVVIAYSGSMESAKAMKHFVQMRLWPDAKLRILTFHQSSEQAAELLRQAEEYCNVHGFDVCHDTTSGDPGSLLLPASNLWKADMIVMGNSSRSVLLRKILGDTLLSTLRNSQIPLFLSQ